MMRAVVAGFVVALGPLVLWLLISRAHRLGVDLLRLFRRSEGASNLPAMAATQGSRKTTLSPEPTR